MYSPAEDSKRIVYGYHNKKRNKYDIVKKGYPLIIDNDFQPFLVTRDSIYTISFEEVFNTVKKYQTYKLFKSVKSKFANIIIIPGLVVAVIYILKLFGGLKTIGILEASISENILNTIFWLSTVGVIMLWHDNFSDFVTPSKLPKLNIFSEHELDQVRNGDIRFGRYANTSTLQYFTEELLEFLLPIVQQKNLNPIDLLKKLVQDESIKAILKRSDLENISKYITENVDKKNMPSYPIISIKSLLLYSLEEALASDSEHLEIEHVFLALCKVFPILNKYLKENNSSIAILRESLSYEQNLYKQQENHILDPKFPYFRTNGIARNWVYGYTFVLDHFSKDVNFEVSNTKERYGIGHSLEVDELISVIGRVGKRNALLIGDPGVGKSSMIKGLAQRINKGDVPTQLQHMRIVQLDLNGLFGYKASEKNTEEVVKKAFEELNKAGNTILYIDELQELIPSKAEESGHSIAGILLTYITDSTFPVIGTTNYSNYKKYFYTNESFRQLFTNIELKELTPKETMEILRTKVDDLEKNFKMYITTSALASSVEYAQRYVQDRMLPDSAVDLLESGCSWAQANKVDVLTDEHIAKVTSIQTSIDVESIDSEDLESVSNLAEKIKRRVVGEDDAVDTIVETLKRSKTGLRNPNKPIGVFLFIGPTGVGKTHLAKVVAEEFFRNKEDIVRLDMSEYQGDDSVQKILGKASGEYQQTNISLLDRVKTNPYTIVLFDEIEKANSSVLDLFLQLFDEGRITSSAGELVDFTNTIIVCTSNIGSDIIMNEVSNKEYLWDDIESKVLMQLKQSIRPELFNRFDSVVVFKPHTMDTIASISELILSELYNRLLDQGITLKWDKTIPMLIANKAYDPALGARPIKRYVQENIEGRIAQEIIDGNIKSGSDVDIKESWIV